MRHYINIISALILAALAGNSCVKESVAAIGGEGEPVELTLDVTSRALDKVIVKSWDPNDEDEAKVNDLRVYIFSESGALVGYKYFGKADLNFSADLDSENGYNSSATLTGIKTVTGNAYVYAIANAITSQYQVTETDAKEITNIDETDLSSSDLTREKFLAATYSRQAGSYDPRDNTFFMSGYVNNGHPVTIRRKTGGTGVAEIVSPTEDKDKRLKLFKVFSKNKLTIETGNDAAGNAISFDPDYMEIHNVPKTVALLPDGTTDASDFETFERVVLDEKYLNFYLPENLQSKNKINTISVWNDREKNTYSAAGDKSFVNAPDNATYLVVHGRYRAGSYVGNVAYTIHLGDFGNNGSLDNFDVCRNFSYQYTLKINGVNNFIAEAKKEGDGTIAKDDPGSEGIVIKTTAAGMLHADCHYEARVMIFNKAEVKGLIDNNFGYILKIHTIFGESECLIVTGDGVYEATQYYLDKSSGKVPEPLTKFNNDGTLANPSSLLVGKAGEADFNWVHFVKNTGAAPSSSPSNSPGCRITSNHTKQNVCAYPGTDKTMSVFQFLKELYVAASTDNANAFFDSDGNVYVTCFIDENYYADREWTKYANQTDSRRLYIANDFRLSNDGKSSYAEAKYVIEQNSIWTFYSMNPDLKPYGVETVSEEEEIEGFSVSYSGYSDSYKDDWNGYTVASNYYKVNNQYTPSGAFKIRSASASEPAKQDLYTDAYRACMSRNRDENGNGKIDTDEVKWYLATVDQYKGLWIGESVLPTQAKLFEPTDENWSKLDDAVNNATSGNTDVALKPWHFFTASTQAVFWPEEGASTSPWGLSWSQASKVRCVRTLESNADGRKDPGVFYDAPVKNADGSYDITLRLNKGAGRDFQSQPVPCTLERGEASQNEVSRKFRIDAGNLSGTFTRSQITSSTTSPDVLIKKEADVCWNNKNGSADEPWRVPNQKELLVMSVVASNGTNSFKLDNITGFLWSNTYFTGLVKNYKLFNRDSQLTAMYKSGSVGNASGLGLIMLPSYQFTISPSNSNGSVRCVMDVKE